MSNNPTPFGSGGGQQPYQFRPESYGALGNGQIISDVNTNGTTTYTSPTIAADPAAVGKFVMINGANGATSGSVIAKILSTNPAANQFTASVAAGATASNCLTVWGSDDTAAFVACEQAKRTYAFGGSFSAQTLLSAKVYCLASAGVQTTAAGALAQQNTQWPIYYPNVNGTTNKYVPMFLGAVSGGQIQYFQSTTINAAGSVVVSMWNGAGGSGLPSVLGGPNASTNLTGLFANVNPVIKNITFVTPAFGSQNVVDCRYCAGHDWDELFATAFASILAGTQPLLPTFPSNAGLASAGAVGFYGSLQANNDNCNVGSIAAEGYAFGVAGAEHFNAQRIASLYCNVGFFAAGAGGVAQHGISILYYSCEATNIGLQSSGIAGDQMPVFIGLMDTEVINTTDVQDTNNTLTGTVYWADFERTTLNISGAANLNIVNTRLNPGHWTGAPAVPASTVAQQNTAWRPASIVVHTGAGVTVSAINVDGTVTGLTIAASSSLLLPKLPSGRNVTLTYAGGTPTWDWWLD